MKTRKPTGVISAAAALALALGVGGMAINHPIRAKASSTDDAENVTTTRTPYEPLGSVTDYHSPPTGFTPVFTEMIARHGARALSDDDDVVLLKELFAVAKSENAFTPLGAELPPAVDRFDVTNAAIGYGQLSGLGKQEHQELAARLLKRLPTLFADAAAKNRHISVLNSGVQRAVDSGTAFVQSLIARAADLKPVIDPAIVDGPLLQPSKAEVGAAYRDYVDNDPTLRAKIEEITKSKEITASATACVAKLFNADFVKRLDAGEFTFTDGDEPTKVARNSLDVATALYNIYAHTFGLSAEGTFDFEKFMDQETLKKFALADNADEFYTVGPSIEGKTITFDIVKPLEDDFFTALDAVVAGKSTDAARLRFAHSETITPLAALMKLPGSEKQVPASATYSYADNPWRGELVAPYAANMQWDVFKGPGESDFLVRMLYNEKESAFKADCAPVIAGSVFYTVKELERCYGR